MRVRSLISASPAQPARSQPTRRHQALLQSTFSGHIEFFFCSFSTFFNLSETGGQSPPPHLFLGSYFKRNLSIPSMRSKTDHRGTGARSARGLLLTQIKPPLLCRPPFPHSFFTIGDTKHAHHSIDTHTPVIYMPAARDRRTWPVFRAANDFFLTTPTLTRQTPKNTNSDNPSTSIYSRRFQPRRLPFSSKPTTQINKRNQSSSKNAYGCAPPLFPSLFLTSSCSSQ